MPRSHSSSEWRGSDRLAVTARPLPDAHLLVNILPLVATSHSLPSAGVVHIRSTSLWHPQPPDLTRSFSFVKSDNALNGTAVGPRLSSLMPLRSTEQIEARAVVRHCVVVCYYLHAHRQWRRGYVPLPVSGRLRKPEGTNGAVVMYPCR